MRCSTVAAAAAIFFGVALAVPQKVVTEIEIVTITSCAPEVTDCPARLSTSTSTSVYVEPTPEPTPETTTCVEEPVYTPPTFPNSTIVVCPGHPSCPEEPSETPIVCPGDESCPEETTFIYTPTGTGSPYPPANTSTPVVPTSPPEYTGAAVKMGASFAAVVGAAALAIFA